MTGHPIYELPVWIAGIFFLACTAAIVSFILASRIVKSLKKKRMDYFRNAYSKSINNLIMHEVYSSSGNPPSAQSFQIAELKKSMNSSSLAKQVMVDQMITQRENLSGASAKVVEQVYELLGLHHFSLKKLSSLNSISRAQGVSELTKMHCHAVIDEIKALGEVGNRIISDKALIALVRLDEKKDLFFLDNYKGELSKWMQLNIYHHLRDVHPRALPEFSRWFNNSNMSVGLFAISMSGEFKQSSAIPALAILLRHTDPQIVESAIDALEQLEAHSACEELLALSDRLWSSERAMAKLVKCLGRIVLPSDGFRVLHLFLNHPSYEVRFEAVKAICSLGPEARETIESFDEANGFQYSKILLHVKDSLLN